MESETIYSHRCSLFNVSNSWSAKSVKYADDTVLIADIYVLTNKTRHMEILECEFMSRKIVVTSNNMFEQVNQYKYLSY